MGKKQYQSQGKYARKATQARKKRPDKPVIPTGVNSSANQDTPSDKQIPSTPLITSRAQSSQSTYSYPYLASDLIHTAIIAGIAFVILIILYFVL